MLSDVSTDYLSEFFIADMVCVRDAQDVSVTSHFQCLYFFYSAVRVHVSQVHSKIDMTSARISVILFFREMLLFFNIGFSLAIAAEVCAILERISDFDPSSDSVAPRYLKLSTVSSSFPLTSIRSCTPFELLVMSFVFSALISVVRKEHIEVIGE